MATAYAALVSLLNDLDLIPNHPFRSFSFDNNQIDSLLQKVCFLIDFMETCDYHGASEAEALEKNIADAAHAAGDVILSHVADQIRSGSTLSRKTRPSRFLLDLQKAIEDMEYVKRKAINFQKVQNTLSSSSLSAATPSTPLTSQKNTMVGFDKVLYKLLDLLTGEAGERVIPIVAMGGAGKTTLARKAFQHKLVAEHFDICLWATISQKYQVEGILNQLLGSKSTGGSVAMLGERLYKTLYGRRYLIVLDDMWSFEAWDEIKFYFPQYEDNKSRIVVTSRQLHLAHHLTSSPYFRLRHLDKEKSWDLFCEKVFGDQKGCPPELEEQGHKIVKKCGGLPLAIVVVGGHLRNSLRTQEYWETVAYHMNSILGSDVNEPCLDILSLSYSCLPVHLKPCFLYMGILKEDQSIDASRLIKLWIGEGFIKPSKTQSLEEVAEGWLKDLVDRNLILACERNWNGKIKSCQLHDIVRELCLKIVVKEKFFSALDAPQATHRERRVVYPEIRSSSSTPHIRSPRVLNEVDGDFLGVGCHQVNIRHLGCFLDWDNLRHISPSISFLWSLQTIIVRKFVIQKYTTAPHEIWEMLQLRHLEMDKIRLPDPLPSDSGRSVQGNLQTLEQVWNLRLSEEVCKRISQIKNLRIEYTDWGSGCDDVRSCTDLLHNFSHLHKLESLSCRFLYEPEWHGFARKFKFPNSLKDLSLSNCKLYWEEFSMMAGSLPLLQTLILGVNAVIGQWNTIEGHFDHLKFLRLRYCDDLVNFNADSFHFPALVVLELWDVPKLDELPSCIGELPSLHRISLRNCSVSLAMSAMRILVEQEQEYGNEGLQLEVYFEYYEPIKSKRVIFKEKMQEEGLTSNNLHTH